MAVADIQDEIFDILTPPQIRQQILGVVLCLVIPLLPFTMLVTELTHKLLSLSNYPDHINCNELYNQIFSDAWIPASAGMTNVST